MIDLDAPIIDYLPEFRVADLDVRRQVTPRHFLSHTSGIDGDFFPDSGRGDDSVERFVDMCAMLPNIFQPGAMMSYCNVGFAVLGRIIEVLTRTTYDASLRQRIFAPLGMDHALSLPEDTLRFRSAIGHVPDPKKKGALRVTPALFLSHGQKAAGSTPTMSASDLLKFAFAHMNGGKGANGARILSASSVNAMRVRQVKLLKHAPRGLTGWGLGWFLSRWGATPVIGHDGGTMGQFAFLRIARDKRLAVALLTNGGDAMGLYREIFDALFVGLAKIREPALAEINPSTKVDLNRVLGRYENITTIVDVDQGRSGPRMTLIGKGGLGTVPINNAPIGFIDRNTARLATGDEILDRTMYLFSQEEDGRTQYVASGLRQFMRSR